MMKVWSGDVSDVSNGMSIAWIASEGDSKSSVDSGPSSGEASDAVPVS